MDAFLSLNYYRLELSTIRKKHRNGNWLHLPAIVWCASLASGIRSSRCRSSPYQTSCLANKALIQIKESDSYLCHECCSRLIESISPTFNSPLQILTFNPWFNSQRSLIDQCLDHGYSLFSPGYGRKGTWELLQAALELCHRGKITRWEYQGPTNIERYLWGIPCILLGIFP